MALEKGRPERKERARRPELQFPGGLTRTPGAWLSWGQGVWRARSAWMAGPVKDREAFQRLNFLYQVSPRLTHGGEPSAEGPQ